MLKLNLFTINVYVMFNHIFFIKVNPGTWFAQLRAHDALEDPTTLPQRSYSAPCNHGVVFEQIQNDRRGMALHTNYIKNHTVVYTLYYI